MQSLQTFRAGPVAGVRPRSLGLSAPQALSLRALPARASRLGRLATRAQEGGADADAEFEERLAALKRAKGETPYGEASSSSSKAAVTSGAKPVYDYTGETLYFESGPHAGDIAVNVLLGVTLIWLPLSLAAVGRGAFVKYRFTDRRLSCITTAPWKNEQLDAAYQEVKDVVTIGRGVGLWGDMLITLKDGSKIEMRAIPRHTELKEYILQRRDALGGSGGKRGGGAAAPAAKAAPSAPKGFSS